MVMQKTYIAPIGAYLLIANIATKNNFQVIPQRIIFLQNLVIVLFVKIQSLRNFTI